MKKIIPFIAISISFFVSSSAFSQTLGAINNDAAMGEITGTVRNSETGHVVPNIAIIILKDGDLITGTVADERGRFHVAQLEVGTYDVKISGTEFQDKTHNGVVVAANKVTRLEPQETEIDFKKPWTCLCESKFENSPKTPKNSWTPGRMVKQSVDFNIFFSSSSN